MLTTLGGSTDGAVRSLTRKYDNLGRLTKITSHGNQTDDPDNTADIANQIVYSYNGHHLVSKSQQSHQGAAGGTTPNVIYAHDVSAESTVYNDGLRPYHLVTPSRSYLFYDYGLTNSLTDRLQTPQRLRDTNATGTIWTEYSHSGSGRTVTITLSLPDEG